MRGAFLAFTLVVLLAGCSGRSDDTAPATSPEPGSVADPAEAFTMDGSGCRELLVLMSVPAAQARPFVPDGYTLLGAASSSATAFAALRHCADVELNGQSLGAASTADAGVFVDKGEPGVLHYYQTWWMTDSMDLWVRLEGQGWPVLLSDDSLTFTPLAQTANTNASVDAIDAGFDLAGSVAFAAATGATRAVGWHDGPLGTLTVDKLQARVQLGSGTGTVAARGEAAALYGANALGLAQWNEYDLRGNVGLA